MLEPQKTLGGALGMRKVSVHGNISRNHSPVVEAAQPNEAGSPITQDSPQAKPTDYILRASVGVWEWYPS